MRAFLPGIARNALPEWIRRRFGPRYRRAKSLPPVGAVRFGSLRRLTPIARNFGLDRGTPVDRHYIDRFLADRGRSAIRGRVLEIGDTRYTDRFGDPALLERVDVLDVSADNPQATVVADLADAPQLESGTYDCIICTQTLLLIYDVRAALATLARILKPGGVLLLTVPGISQICRPEMDQEGDYWRFTSRSLLRLLEEAFDGGELSVQAYGNVLTASAFLYGVVTEDLRPAELDHHDPDYELLIGAVAVKDSAAAMAR